MTTFMCRIVLNRIKHRLRILGSGRFEEICRWRNETMKPPFVSTMISFWVSNQSIRSCQLLVSQISVSSLLSVPKCDQNFHFKLKVFVADQVQAAVTLFDF